MPFLARSHLQYPHPLLLPFQIFKICDFQKTCYSLLLSAFCHCSPQSHCFFFCTMLVIHSTPKAGFSIKFMKKFVFKKKKVRQSNMSSPITVSAGGQLLPYHVWLKNKERKMKCKSSGFWLVVIRRVCVGMTLTWFGKLPWASLKWLKSEKNIEFVSGSTPKVNLNFTVTFRTICISMVCF